MQHELIFAGFGGQGIMFGGQLLAYAAMDSGYHVTWIPSYGPEMRGGTAYCTVVIADQEIGSPVVKHPGIGMIFNAPSFDKFVPLLQPNGLLIYNASLIPQQTERQDLTILPVPATERAPTPPADQYGHAGRAADRQADPEHGGAQGGVRGAHARPSAQPAGGEPRGAPNWRPAG